MKNLLIIGAGGHGKVCAEIAENMNKWKKIYFIDDNLKGFVNDFEIKGTISNLNDFDSRSYDVFVAIGDNKLRMKISNKVKKQKFNLISLISPRAIISNNVEILKNVVIMPGVVINTNVTIDEGVIINTASVIEHDCKIGKYSHISPNSTLCGSIEIGELVWIGAGTTIKQNIKIIDDVIVGMGSIVLKNINQKGLYYGLI